MNAQEHKDTRAQEHRSHLKIQLSPAERDFMYVQPAITTVTFFHGRPPTDFLRQRVADMLVQNPWLSSRLCIDDCRLTFLYDTMPHAELFNVESTRGIRTCTPMPLHEWEKLRELCEVKTWERCVDNMNEPLFKVRVVPDVARPTERFVLVVSMSHLLGDARTVYQVQNMLGRPACVKALNPNHSVDVGEALSAKMGEAEAGIFQSPGFLKAY